MLLESSHYQIIELKSSHNELRSMLKQFSSIMLDISKQMIAVQENTKPSIDLSQIVEILEGMIKSYANAIRAT